MLVFYALRVTVCFFNALLAVVDQFGLNLLLQIGPSHTVMQIAYTCRAQYVVYTANGAHAALEYMQPRPCPGFSLWVLGQNLLPQKGAPFSLIHKNVSHRLSAAPFTSE